MGQQKLAASSDALADALVRDERIRAAGVPDALPLEYGSAFGATVRFRTKSGEAPVLRMLWRREDGAWRIVAYDVELP